MNEADKLLLVLRGLVRRIRLLEQRLGWTQQSLRRDQAGRSGSAAAAYGASSNLLSRDYFWAKIVGPASGQGNYYATPQMMTDAATFENWPDWSGSIVVRRPDGGSLDANAIVPVRWEGQGSDGTDWFVVAASDGGAARLRYKSMGDNHLVCRTWNGTTEGTTDITVAKPYLLRESTTRTGYTYNYTGDQARTSTKTSDSSTEDQVIVPEFVLNDQIWAISTDTGVTVGTTPVKYLDLNVDARAWAKK
ncbi:MAG TPA: hypothetical protein PLL65_20955 [Phycisphaerae bacterium]|nr:hypothetical protein [Phycisphaerae bacterium]HON68605.1 hypothetical protein [Phycisphaerae bacterium]